ncbi:MAG: methionyl-tRNA formyltransferase [Candidatus Burarchaeum sp.]|nr:methionyl-tRNA formyltransferase [Candidatus Burarchaeum sp.]MDO8339048.1 methionyl-tRNA formyltransferase [Candidatus Burarchaeum sp.]
MAEGPKIAVIGNGTIAVECCRHLLGQGENIAFIIGDHKDDGTDGWQKSLKKFAQANGISFHQPEGINEQKWYDFFAEQAPDFLLSFQYRFIIKRPIIESAKKLAANIHFAPLPRYRGMYPIAWALLNGEKTFGVTIHAIDPGVDSGDILAQKLFPIEEEDTAKTLYLKAVKNGVELFSESWPSLRSMTVTRKTQDAKKVLYYPAGSIDFSKNGIDWSKPADEVFNFIRAFIFVPFQLPTTHYEGKLLRVVKVQRKEETVVNATPGEVLGVSDVGVQVACGTGSLEVALSEEVSEEVPAQLRIIEKFSIRKGGKFS